MKIGLVGRTNVGKSTLFNRLLGSYRAIVTDISGTTRELLEEEISLGGQFATLVDSPGLEKVEDEMQFIQQIIQESDIILFVIDGKSDLSEQEYNIRKMILNAEKKDRTIMVVNKLDGKIYNDQAQQFLGEFYTLGFERIVPISAEQEEGLEAVVDHIQIIAKNNDLERGEPVQRDYIPLAIVGRPNVGKSTLLNKLVGEQLAHVKDEPGTTLDYITADLEREGKKIKLYDTAGIKKKSKTVGLEKIAYAKTLAMLEHIRPVVVMMIDLTEGLTHRDKSLLGEIIKLGLPIVIALNKIDTSDPDDIDLQIKYIDLRSFGWIPQIKISGQEGIGLPGLIQTVVQIYHNATTRISTGELNKAVQTAWITKPPRFPKNKICKRKYISQVDEYPPTFSLSVNNKKFANFSFVRWLENVIRKEYDFEGVPIQFRFINKVETNPYLNT